MFVFWKQGIYKRCTALRLKSNYCISCCVLSQHCVSGCILSQHGSATSLVAVFASCHVMVSLRGMLPSEYVLSLALCLCCFQRSALHPCVSLQEVLIRMGQTTAMRKQPKLFTNPVSRNVLAAKGTSTRRKRNAAL